ncbi:MAG: hypothetical protein ACRDDY_03750 [Clostridium sp.]|uniref:hypothetical protein n=1 Tax=Clostridium sp. TaxID=1506 RepID=UPI003EE67AB8
MVIKEGLEVVVISNLNRIKRDGVVTKLKRRYFEVQCGTAIYEFEIDGFERSGDVGDKNGNVRCYSYEKLKEQEEREFCHSTALKLWNNHRKVKYDTMLRISELLKEE